MEAYLHKTEMVIPLRRGRDISEKLWATRRKEVEVDYICPIDYWAYYLIGENSTPSALVSPNGLYMCGCIPEVCKIGKLGEPLSVIEPRVRKIGRFVRAMSAFDPKVVAKKMNEAYGLDISTEHDCISCHELFDRAGYWFIEAIIEGGTFEGVIDEMMEELNSKQKS